MMGNAGRGEKYRLLRGLDSGERGMTYENEVFWGDFCEQG